MESRKKTFSERLSYIFSSHGDKGTTFFDRLILQMLGAEDAWVARKDNQQEKQLIDMIAEMSGKMGLSYPPPLLIYQSDKPNAASLISGKIVIGTNLIEILTPGQLKAVIGHELAHHRHLARDWTVRLSTLAGALWGIRIIAKVNKKTLKKEEIVRTRGNVLEWLDKGKTKTPISNKVLLEDAAILIGANLIGKAHQRVLEYEADKEAGIYTGNAGDMSDALLNLQKRIEEIKLEKLKKENPNIIFPMESNDDKPKPEPTWIQRVGKGITHLFADHPPFDKRIERLEMLEEQQQQLPAGSSVVR